MGASEFDIMVLYLPPVLETSCLDLSFEWSYQPLMSGAESSRAIAFERLELSQDYFLPRLESFHHFIASFLVSWDLFNNCCGGRGILKRCVSITSTAPSRRYSIPFNAFFKTTTQHARGLNKQLICRRQRLITIGRQLMTKPLVIGYRLLRYTKLLLRMYSRNSTTE